MVNIIFLLIFSLSAGIAIGFFIGDRDWAMVALTIMIWTGMWSIYFEIRDKFGNQ